MTTSDDPSGIDTALESLLAHADRLPQGDGEHHVRASARELASACSLGEGVSAAVDRFAASVRQLQFELQTGSRRRERHDAAQIERLLEVLQEELLPELRRTGLLQNE